MPTCASSFSFSNHKSLMNHAEALPTSSKVPFYHFSISPQLWFSGDFQSQLLHLFQSTILGLLYLFCLYTKGFISV